MAHRGRSGGCLAGSLLLAHLDSACVCHCTVVAAVVVVVLLVLAAFGAAPARDQGGGQRGQSGRLQSLLHRGERHVYVDVHVSVSLQQHHQQ